MKKSVKTSDFKGYREHNLSGFQIFANFAGTKIIHNKKTSKIYKKMAVTPRNEIKTDKIYIKDVFE
ncbi:hypothetical protein D0T85_01755 [Bacteroides sp. 519]|nr:hypothetical protein [Bacteroides sp. 519]